MPCSGWTMTSGSAQPSAASRSPALQASWKRRNTSTSDALMRDRYPSRRLIARNLRRRRRRRAEAAPRRAELAAGLRDALGHAVDALRAPRARVERRLAPHAAVDGEDAVVLGEHVAGDRARERVLGFRVEVDLDDAVGDGGRQLLVGRPAAAVEDVLEARAGMVLGQR